MYCDLKIGVQLIFSEYLDVKLVQISASPIVIKLKVQDGCAGGSITSFEAEEIIVKNLVGAVQKVSFVPADSNGEITLMDTGFANGLTVSLPGVITKTDISYDAPEPLVLVIP